MHVRPLIIVNAALAADHGDEESDGFVVVIGPIKLRSLSNIASAPELESASWFHHRP
jgi:hypothetical protein